MGMLNWESTSALRPGDEHLSSIDYRINRRPGKLPHVSDNAIDWERYIENRKSSVRCKVEHAFRITAPVWL